jgi:hypothetical protein
VPTGAQLAADAADGAAKAHAAMAARATMLARLGKFLNITGSSDDSVFQESQ